MDFELHLGDCLPILKAMPDKSVDCVITDPPYGTGQWKREKSGLGSNPTASYSKEEWDVWNVGYLKECLRISRNCIAMFVPTNHLNECLQLGNARLFAYVKSDPRPRFSGQPSYGFEPILVFGKYNPIGGVDYMMDSSPRLNRDSDGTGHPHQKPIGVMRWLVNLVSNPNDTILDPFAGSGSTLVACGELGRKSIGIEQNAGYYQIAKQRTERAYAQKTMF